jgi:hypothetical protein
VNTHLANLIRPYAGWAALVLLVVAIFGGLIAANFTFPLTCLFAAAGLAVFRFWEPLKTFDFWAFDEWARMRFDALGVRDWHAPHHAAEMYCSQVAVRTRNEAAAEMNVIMMELIRGQERIVGASTGASQTDYADPRTFEDNRTDRNAKYDAAQIRYNQCNISLSRELLEHLVRGDLLAKGLPTRDDVAQSERIIPTSRWRVMSLDIAKAQASGLGWHYTGIVVGKRPKARKAPKPSAPPAKPPNLSQESTRGRQQPRPEQPRPPRPSA